MKTWIFVEVIVIHTISLDDFEVDFWHICNKLQQFFVDNFDERQIIPILPKSDSFRLLSFTNSQIMQLDK